MISIYKEEYGVGYYYLDHFSYWSHVNYQVEFYKICMAEYKNKVNEAHTTKERLEWMKGIMKLVSWGFEPKL